jgi:hypothetical protein
LCDSCYNCCSCYCWSFDPQKEVSSLKTTQLFSFFDGGGTPFSQKYPQRQTLDEMLQQMGDLGLQWYYDCAIENYQNKMGVTPEINALEVSIKWESYTNYQGLTLMMIGSYERNGHGSGIFFANFQPDGTLNYFSTTNR